MDFYHDENPYFQDEYISEEQYINHSDEDIYDYGHNSQEDEQDSEELGYEEDFDQE